MDGIEIQVIVLIVV